MTANVPAVLMTARYYNRTESGKGWSTAPYEIINEIIPYEWYLNMIDPMNIRFFNRFKDACQRSFKGNTPIGYTVNRITTIAPFKEYRRVETFEFIDSDQLNAMRAAAGYREREVMSNAVTFTHEPGPDYVISFYTAPDATGHRNGASWSLTRRAWVG